MGDETMDIDGIEQLSFDVRFYDRKDEVIKEEFLGFSPLQHGLDAETIATYITGAMTNWALNLE